VKWKVLDPPREYATGRGDPITIRDCARLELAPNEQVTFVTESGAEYDVTRKGWGFYATPSINGRLLNFGLRAALIRSYVGKYYLFLIERGKEEELSRYLGKEKNELVRWLDNDDDLRAAEASQAQAASGGLSVHCPCGADRFTSVHMYFEPPAGEVAFPRATPEYRRELFRCSLCRHFVSVHAMDGDGQNLYAGQYVDSTYGDAVGVRRTFERIVGLPPERSDNQGRVRRVLELARAHLAPDRQPWSVLDVGSGLCVFLHGMKAAGWRCTAVDPDPRAVQHAREVVGVEAICGDWMNVAPPDGQRFDLVTFNKVLEHVKDPAAMLRRAADFLAPGGAVYLELPDGEAAAPPGGEGYGREEFFIEHHHIFSMGSVSLLAENAGFTACTVERLREPSTKYTLRALLRLKPTASERTSP
jgi:SAM-dependent methyltransferase